MMLLCGFIVVVCRCGVALWIPRSGVTVWCVFVGLYW